MFHHGMGREMPYRNFLEVPMAQCSRCNSETELYDNGAPVCPACDDAKSGKNQMAEADNNPQEAPWANFNPGP
jgi:uncharacterized Zn ribbon protein